MPRGAARKRDDFSSVDPDYYCTARPACRDRISVSGGAGRLFGFFAGRSKTDRGTPDGFSGRWSRAAVLGLRTAVAPYCWYQSSPGLSPRPMPMSANTETWKWNSAETVSCYNFERRDQRQFFIKNIHSIWTCNGFVQDRTTKLNTCI